MAKAKVTCIKCQRRLSEVLPYESGGLKGYSVYCIEKDKWLECPLALDNKSKGGCQDFKPRLIGGFLIK
jgi:hypothetical protein